MNEQLVVEVVLFRVKEGVADAAFLQEAAVTQAWIEQQPGFISRELLKTPDNQWLDTVRWMSLEFAEQAAARLLDDEHCKPFVSMIDEAGMQMWHFEPQALLNR